VTAALFVCRLDDDSFAGALVENKVIGWRGDGENFNDVRLSTFEIGYGA
jgi:hypothetical protein